MQQQIHTKDGIQWIEVESPKEILERDLIAAISLQDEIDAIKKYLVSL